MKEKKHAVKIVELEIAAHAPAITRLLRKSFSQSAQEMGLTEKNCPYHVAFMTQERLLAQLDHGDTRCIGLRENEEWVGFVAVAPYQGAYEITRLAVAPEYRHRGYGQALVAYACEVAREMGLEKIGLGMIDENTVLKKWYQQQGFVSGKPFRAEGALFTVCEMYKKLIG